MDEYFLVPLFQNESSNEMSYVGANRMNGFAFRLVLTQRQNPTCEWPLG